MGRIFNAKKRAVSDEAAAEKFSKEGDKFLKKIGMWLSLDNFRATMEDMVAIADNSQVLPDYMNTPRIASREDIYEMLVKPYNRP